MIVSIDMITSTDSYYCGWSNLYIHFKNTRERRFEFGAVTKSKIVFHLIPGAFTSQVKIQLKRAPVGGRK